MSTEDTASAYCFWEMHAICLDTRNGRSNETHYHDLSIEEAKKLLKQLKDAIDCYTELEESVQEYFKKE